MLHRIILLTGVVLSWAAAATGAPDWPEFRGPTGQGQATASRLPLEWDATRNIAWKQSIPGHGWSSPVLKDGLLYLTSAIDGGNGSRMPLHVLCLDEQTGKIRWDIEVFEGGPGDAPRIHNKNSHASPTPLVADGRVYVHFGHRGTACLDLEGKVLWRNTSLPYPPVHGSGGSPILADSALIFSCDGGSDPF